MDYTTKQYTTGVDLHGRILIPSAIRAKLNIKQGDKVNLVVCGNEVKIVSPAQTLDEMHTIFTKNKTSGFAVDDFIKQRRLEFGLESKRDTNDR